MPATENKLTPRGAASDDASERTSAEKYVYSALRGQGVKFADLTDEQRERALSAPDVHPGLRGKSVARWILDGADLTVQLHEAENERVVREAEATHERRSAAAKNSSHTPTPPSAPKHDFTDEERALIERTQGMKMKDNGEKYGNAISPLEVLTYRECIRKTPGFLSGVSKAEMERIATGAERVPHHVSKRWSGMYADLKSSWHWMKGIIAVAVADGYEPPPGEPESKPTPEPTPEA